MKLLDTLRVFFGMCDRRLRSKLGLGDRRRSREACEADARETLATAAWIKWKGERKAIDPDAETKHD